MNVAQDQHRHHFDEFRNDIVAACHLHAESCYTYVAMNMEIAQIIID